MGMVTNQSFAARDLTQSRHIGDFNVGDVYYHGGVQITPMRNRTYIATFNDGLLLGANPLLSEHLLYMDPFRHGKKDIEIKNPGLVSQGFVFNSVFGLSVHDISLKAIANRSYSDLRYGSPLFEGDHLYAKSQVLGIKFSRDDATQGNVQVRTTGINQQREIVLEYVREVTVRAEPGKSYAKLDATVVQPNQVSITLLNLPKRYHGLHQEDLGPHGKTAEAFVPGSTWEGLHKGSLDLRMFSWLQIATQNDAAVHHTSHSHFIGYGGAIKAFAEGQISGLFPFAYHLGMSNGTHSAPTYPKDTLVLEFGGDPNESHEQLHSRIKILRNEPIHGREDISVITYQLVTDKLVTDSGMKALEAVKFAGIKDIQRVGNERLLKVLDLEQIVAVPTNHAFK